MSLMPFFILRGGGTTAVNIIDEAALAESLDDSIREMNFYEYLMSITPPSQEPVEEAPQPLLEPVALRAQYDEEEEDAPHYPAEEDITDGLIAHWTLDMTSGTGVADAVGTYPGQVFNNPTWRPTSGVIGGCLELNGINQYADFRNEPNLIGVPKTYTVWVRPDTIVGQRGILSKMSNLAATDGDGFLLEQDDTFARVTADAPTFQIAYNCLAVGAWVFLGVVLEGSEIRLYVNGNRVLTAAFGGVVTNFPSGGFLIGRQNNLNRYFDGRVDDVRVYERALSDLDIAALYAEV